MRPRDAKSERVHVVEARRRHPSPLDILQQFVVVVGRGRCCCCSRCRCRRRGRVLWVDLLLVDLVVDQLGQGLLRLEERIEACGAGNEKKRCQKTKQADFTEAVISWKIRLKPPA